MGKECVVCKVIIQENSWVSHILGKKHRQQVARQQSTKESADRSIFVTGFPIGTNAEELISYFIKFGGIRNVIVDKNQGKFAILEFDQRHQVQNILKQQHLFRGKMLWVKPRRCPPLNNRQVEVTTIDQLLLIKEILKAKDVVDQMKRLMTFVKLSPANIKLRQDFCDKMSSVLRSFFLGCSVHLYGSSINGLGMCTSDMDLHLSWNVEDVRPLEENKEELSFQKIRRKVLQEKSPVSSHTMATLSPQKAIKLLSTIIKVHVRGCSRVFAIMARCPIVRFYCQPLNLSCDLSTKNKLALYNSALIKFYCDLDFRIPLLLFTIRYWFKIQKISCGQGHHLSNYALTMLVLFFLQNCRPPVIPTTDQLQQNSKNSIKIGGWECFSCDDLKNIPPSENKDNAYTLLKKFITFYDKFDFETMTVAPKTGLMIPKEEIKEKFSDFKSTLVCIQDPFELNHNVAASVNVRTFRRMINLLDMAKTTCDNESEWSPNSGKDWGLAVLFNLDVSDEKTVVPDPIPKTFLVSSSDVIFNIDISEQLRNSCSALIQSESVSVGKLGITVQLQWYKKICSLIMQILNQALFIKCKTEKKQKPSPRNNDEQAATSSSGKKLSIGNKKRSLKMECEIPAKLYHIQDLNNKKIAVASPTESVKEDVDELDASMCIKNLDPPITFHCTIFNRTWINRKKMRHKLSPQGYTSILAFEKNVSLSLIGKLSKTPLFEFTLTLDQPKSQLATGVVATLHPLSPCKELRWAVFPFLESYLLKMVNQLLTEQSQK